MKISIFSHAYVSVENRKNIRELAKLAGVHVVLPHAVSDQLGRGKPDLDPGEAAQYSVFRRVGLFGAQYLLASTDLGLSSFAPDIVHVEYDPWAVLFWQVCAYRQLYAPTAKLVCTIKKNTYREYPGPLGRAKDRLARTGIRRVDHFLATSRMVADLYADKFGVCGRDVSVTTHLGVDTDLFSPAAERENQQDSGNLRIGYSGSLEPHKGVLDLLEAVKRCRARTGRELELMYLGRGSLSEHFRAEAKCHPWFSVAGPVPHRDVAGFLRRLDIFVLATRVLPDHQEHDAHALLEALAAGLPCIGTRSGIIPEIIGDASGLLVQPESVDGLAEALLSLSANEARRRELGRRGREAALRSFSLPVLALRRADIYRRVLRSHA